MSKNYKIPPVNFLDFLDKQDREGSIPITVGDKTFYVRSAILLSDDEAKRMEAGDDVVEMAKAIVNDYDGLCAALAEAGKPGGAAMAVMAVVGEEAERDRKSVV